jgi:hypothetical protein
MSGEPVVGVSGTLKIEVDGYFDIEVSPNAVQKLFVDEQILKRLIELDITEKKHTLKRMKKYVREVLKEKEKYGLDVEKYPPELIEKLQEAEKLDDKIYELEEEIEILDSILTTIWDKEMAEEMAKALKESEGVEL